mgnify:CR=1 FL=1
MRNILTVILLFLLSFPALSVNDNGNTLGWKTYLSYNNTDCVEESADQVFVVAEGALYTYGKEDNSIKQYYKGNGLMNWQMKIPKSIRCLFGDDESCRIRKQKWLLKMPMRMMLPI